MLYRMSWNNLSEFKIDLTTNSTGQLCDAKAVSKDLLKTCLIFLLSSVF